MLADSSLTTQEEQISVCEQRSIQALLGNLRTFPWGEERVSQGQLELHGWFYDVVSWGLSLLNKEKPQFQEVCD